jgi:hypothetical protein
MLENFDHFFGHGGSVSDATLNPIPPGALPVGVERKDAAVNFDGVDPSLLSFLAKLGLVHLHLFGSPCTVTSARDSVHGLHSKHFAGKALDLRVADLPPKWQPAFLLVLCVLADQFRLTVFDESNLPGAPHIHVEVAG